MTQIPRGTCPLGSGRSADGRRLRLAEAPRIRVDPRSSDVRLEWSD